MLAQGAEAQLQLSKRHIVGFDRMFSCFGASLADLDRDGRMDVALIGYQESGGAQLAKILLNRPDTTWAVTSFALPFYTTKVYAGYLDADAGIDLIFAAPDTRPRYAAL